MFLGDSFYKDEVFDNLVIIDKFNKLELSGAKFDEVYITKDLNDSGNEKNTIWDFDKTIFLNDFQNTTQAGNIYGNLKLGFIKIKRKRIQDMKWEDLKIIPYEKDKVFYSYVDNFVEALEEYEYIIQPISTNGALGNMQAKSIEVADFQGAWLVTEDNMLSLLYNLNVGDYDWSTPNARVETLGNIYPFVMTNGMTKYKKCNIKCMVISDTTINASGVIDRKAEKRFREYIYNFLTDKKPKVYKDSSGEYMVVSIIGEPKISPLNNLSQKIYELSFDCIEVGTKELLTLHHAGIIK